MSHRFIGQIYHQSLNGVAVVTTLPVTISAMVFPTANGGIASLTNTALTGSRALYINGQLVASSTASSTEVLATSTNSVPQNKWSHCCGVFASATSRTVYLNGVDKGTNTTSNSPAAINETYIGISYVRASEQLFTQGYLEHVGFWNVALTDSEVLMLSQGAYPWMIRPQSLVAYYPLVDQKNNIGAANLSERNNNRYNRKTTFDLQGSNSSWDFNAGNSSLMAKQPRSPFEIFGLGSSVRLRHFLRGIRSGV